MEGTGVEGRGGQGRVPDCLGGLSRVGISSRSTHPWNGQPPSIYCNYMINDNPSNRTRTTLEAKQRRSRDFCLGGHPADVTR